ncbi:hypothetical protein NONO_c60550 [Nocardia nova SH22a]|uniref:Uncharacterized protein n=1 Tax=Nocardia nova SH22a TaxID=1415166 RepID=W5TUF7_9NOCA|nr:hypothetical protein [Nocardia nova]AHH20831.1 hypothetical protein NONO_c60550 [Nocardia nova SH22a]
MNPDVWGVEDVRSREFHYVITLQYHDESGRAWLRTQEGIYRAAPGCTRQKAYNVIRDSLGHPDSNTTFFSLEPNEL